LLISILKENVSVADNTPIARSPIAPPQPIQVVDGWEVSGKRSSAPLRITDCTPLAKVIVRADQTSDTARQLGVSFGRIARNAQGALVIGSGPGEWTILGGIGSAPEIMQRITPPEGAHVAVVDSTHGRALIRITGADGARTLSKLCPVDLSDKTTPDGAAFRSAIAALVTDVIRDDVSGAPNGPTSNGKVRSYLLHCERSSGQYLLDTILDAGAEFGIEVDGFAKPGI
jgi:heterotetrameric sarcosine oxidase gamma subunit